MPQSVDIETNNKDKKNKTKMSTGIIYEPGHGYES